MNNILPMHLPAVFNFAFNRTRRAFHALATHGSLSYSDFPQLKTILTLVFYIVFYISFYMFLHVGFILFWRWGRFFRMSRLVLNIIVFRISGPPRIFQMSHFLNIMIFFGFLPPRDFFKCFFFILRSSATWIYEKSRKSGASR